MNFVQAATSTLTTRKAVNDPLYVAQAPAAQSISPIEQVAQSLACASQSNKWVLFTGQCPKPDMQWLSKRNVDCTKVVYLKNSTTQPQIQVIMDAILSGNASAVVATNDVDQVTQQQLIQLGEQNQCTVHFISVPAGQRLH